MNFTHVSLAQEADIKQDGRHTILLAAGEQWNIVTLPKHRRRPANGGLSEFGAALLDP